MAICRVLLLDRLTIILWLMYPFSTIKNLQTQVEELTTEIKKKDQENESLRDQLTELKTQLEVQEQNDNGSFQQELLNCAVHSLMQIQGIRETV